MLDRMTAAKVMAFMEAVETALPDNGAGVKFWFDWTKQTVSIEWVRRTEVKIDSAISVCLLMSQIERTEIGPVALGKKLAGEMAAKLKETT